jgi:hypothetical protein
VRHSALDERRKAAWLLAAHFEMGSFIICYGGYQLMPMIHNLILWDYCVIQRQS